MNIYKLKGSELVEIEKEFVKTVFGRRVKYFSTVLPLLVNIFSLLLAIAFSFINAFIDDGCELLECTCWFIYAMSYLTMFITQIQYNSMLKDYVNSKEKN